MAGDVNLQTGCDDDGDVVIARPGGFYGHPVRMHPRTTSRVGATYVAPRSPRGKNVDERATSEAPSVREAQVLPFTPFFSSPDIEAAAARLGLSNDQKTGLGDIIQIFRGVGFQPKPLGSKYGSVFELGRNGETNGHQVTIRVMPIPGPTEIRWSLLITSEDSSIHVHTFPLTLTGLKNAALRQSTRLQISGIQQLDLNF